MKRGAINMRAAASATPPNQHQRGEYRKSLLHCSAHQEVVDKRVADHLLIDTKRHKLLAT
jgi:hypothetical protein